MKKRADEKKSFSVYVDWTTERDPRPFYVGKGNGNRVKGLERNLHHQHVAAKHGLKREVVFSTSVESLAFKVEVELIAEHHTYVDDPQYNGVGTNYTPGGEGHVPCAATRQKIKRRMLQSWADPEWRAKVSAAMKEGAKGRKMPEHWCRQKSESMLGEKNWNFGRNFSEQHRARLSAKAKGREPWNKGGRQWQSFVPVNVLDLDDGFEYAFESFQDAAKFVSEKTGNSYDYLRTRLSKRAESFKNFVFDYDVDKGNDE